MAGDGVPNQMPAVVFEPTTGNLVVQFTFAQHGNLTRTQFNNLRAAGVNAGGMANVPAAYAAIRGAWDGVQSGRDAWLDRMTSGVNSAETDLLRRGVVWAFVSRGEIPSPPQP